MSYHHLLSLSLSLSLRIPLDERLVPVSRLDYQNIILGMRMYVIAIDKCGKRI